MKVWEVIFNRDGEFSDVKRVMDLKGHRASVYYFSFNVDSTRFAGTVRLSVHPVGGILHTRSVYTDSDKPMGLQL